MAFKIVIDWSDKENDLCSAAFSVLRIIYGSCSYWHRRQGNKRDIFLSQACICLGIGCIGVKTIQVGRFPRNQRQGAEDKAENCGKGKENRMMKIPL